jgi:hypothetical protein
MKVFILTIEFSPLFAPPEPPQAFTTFIKADTAANKWKDYKKRKIKWKKIKLQKETVWSHSFKEEGEDIELLITETTIK